MNVSADPVQTYTADTWPANRWPNFSFAEMACRETGECLLDGALMDALQRVRAICGPLTVTSGSSAPAVYVGDAEPLCVERRRTAAYDVYVRNVRLVGRSLTNFFLTVVF